MPRIFFKIVCLLAAVVMPLCACVKNGGSAATTPKPPLDISEPFLFEAIDIGKGDCLLIICEGKVMLVDAGYAHTADIVIDRLKAYGVERIDTLVLTHPHKDHVGGMAAVLRAFEVGEVLTGPAQADSDEYEDFVYEAGKRGLPLKVAEAGEEFALGGALVRVVQARADFGEVNDTSVVLRVTYGKTAFLLTGDIEKEGEEALIKSGENISADVLKVAHHGRSGSTGKALLSAVKPSVAVITCNQDDADNKPPSEKVIARMLDADIAVYRSDVDGNITVMTNGETVYIITGSGYKEAA